MFIYNIDLPKKMRGKIIERDLIKKNLNGVQFEENIFKKIVEKIGHKFAYAISLFNMICIWHEFECLLMY